MGVIPVDQRNEIPLDAAARAKIDEGTVLAVTLEQKGGSPTGVAQGPIVAAGHRHADLERRVGLAPEQVSRPASPSQACSSPIPGRERNIGLPVKSLARRGRTGGG